MSYFKLRVECVMQNIAFISLLAMTHRIVYVCGGGACEHVGTLAIAYIWRTEQDGGWLLPSFSVLLL